MHTLFRAALLCLLSLPLFAATGLVDTVKQYRDLSLGTAKSVTDYRFTVGHATFSLPSGTVTPVLAGERQVGVYLSGSGTFTYESANKDEFVTMRSNAKDGDVKLQAGADKVAYTDAFKGVLLLGNGLPAATGADAAAPAAQFAEDQALFERDDFLTVPVGHLFAYQALEDPAARVVYAEISGPSHPVIYEYDDVYAHDEELTFLRKRMFRHGKFGDAMWGTLLSRQAIGRKDRQAAPARVHLTNVDVNLTGTLDEQGKMVVVETLVPQGKPANVLRFGLTSDYFFDIEYEPRHFNLRSVTDGKGNKLPFIHDAHDLLVALPAPAPAGTPLTLRFEIDGDFLYRPQKSNYWELGIEEWFPWVRPQEQAFTFHSVVKVEKPFVVFASGNTVRRGEEGNFNVLETKLDQPVSYVAILAGKYHFDEETRNGVTVRVASFISKNERAFKTLRNFAYTTIDAYQKFLGPFPFEELTIIEKDAFGYGQAPAGIVFIAKEAFLPKDEDANEYIQGVNRRLAHEIAHQYWGGVTRITMNDDQWLQEAFAEYSAYVFLKNTNLEHQATRGFNEWKAEAKDANAVSTIPMANRLVNGANPGVARIQRQGLIYAKGALLLAALHRELGDQAFLTFLKSYQKSFRWKYGTTEDAIGLLQFMTKKDYGPWFNENYYGTGLPDVKGK
jgi:hypothetical protein